MPDPADGPAPTSPPAESWTPPGTGDSALGAGAPGASVDAAGGGPALGSGGGAGGWRVVVRGAAEVLARAAVPSPEVDARLLAEHLLGRPLVLAGTPTPGQLTAYAALVERRRTREPLQHITGEMYFRHLRLRAASGAFVVRPETELVAEHAIRAAREVAAPRVVDLCTGSGAIALAVATEVPGSQVWAVELSEAALEVAGHNVDELAPQVRLVAGDAASALSELDGTLDVVVSNPPYVPPDAVPRDPEVREHDPDLALYGGGSDGLAVPRQVIASAARLLRPGGTFVMEHADVQGPAVRVACEATGAFAHVRTERDLTGRDRMVLAQRV